MIKDRIQKAKIKIVQKCSFYGHILLHMNFKIDNSMETMGVDAQGNLYYCEEFMNKLTDEEIIGTILHEIMHIALMSFDRRQNRIHYFWNIATDVMINNLLVNESFSLPKEGIIPKNNQIDLGGLTIKELDKKTAEEVYNLIFNKIEKDIKNFDKHLESKGRKSNKDKNKNSRKWKNIVRDALTISKMRGDLPKSLETLFEELHDPKVDWRQKLRRYIKNEIPNGYSYHLPHKRSISTGFYMPINLKERIDISIVIDTSGSIGKKEYTDFMSEVIGIASEFKDKIEMRVISHDVEVSDDYLIKNANRKKIMDLKIHGGGGTSHKPVFEYLKEKYPNTKLVIFFTDGFSDLKDIIFKEYRFNKIFIISKGGLSEDINNQKCEVIKL